MTSSDQFFIGKELIRVLLETYDLTFSFSGYDLEVSSCFVFQTPDGVCHKVDGRTQEGNVNVIWRAIGSKVIDARIDKSLSLDLDNNCKIIIDLSPDEYVLNIRSSDGKIWEDL